MSGSESSVGENNRFRSLDAELTAGWRSAESSLRDRIAERTTRP